MVYLSFENGRANLTDKALCSFAAADYQRLRMGFVEPARIERGARALLPEVGDRLHLRDGDGHWTVNRLRAEARRAMERADTGNCLVVVDYLQLWAKNSRELSGFTDPRLRVEALAADLLALARQVKSPVLAVSSMSREGSKRSRNSDGAAPELEFLKESGDLEYGADVALMLAPSRYERQSRPAASSTEAMTLWVSKHRHGPTGPVDLIFRRDLNRVEETDHQREDRNLEAPGAPWRDEETRSSLPAVGRREHPRGPARARGAGDRGRRRGEDRRNQDRHLDGAVTPGRRGRSSPAW